MSVHLINPATEKSLGVVPWDRPASVLKNLEKAQLALPDWDRMELAGRRSCVETLIANLRADREALAQQITLEMGKPWTQALAEVDKSTASAAVICERFSDWLQVKEENLSNGFSVRMRPLGVILGVMPWNFPLWQVIRFAVPALLSGNTILLKHAPNTFGVAERIGQLFKGAFPKDVYRNIRIQIPQVNALIKDPRLRGVSLTGSRQAGAAVGALAGAHLKKSVLELGGSDAYLIMADAEIEAAARICARSRLQNAGQSCVAAKRFIVAREVIKPFTEALMSEMLNFQPADPMNSETLLGPMARKDLRRDLHKQVQASIRKGAKLLMGGKLSNGLGYFYGPTVLTRVRPGQEAFDEELFGPVAAIIEAKSEQQAIELANRSRYGLGGAIFSQDLEKAQRLATEALDAGMVFVNDMVRSDALVPFGGVKDSGLGRELGREGVFEFTNIKTVFSK